ncbi:hypothetical protein RND71_007693 [Anisodus tanguticus]|uniref:Uncharacterized protein n=1 Tax=Anisodus tanguticus TaxID=243964 RepID=A0AAE1VT97_9SOLA|nr:hypothetical protein RND71_007693 [Anisodus tanguticus]
MFLLLKSTWMIDIVNFRKFDELYCICNTVSWKISGNSNGLIFSLMLEIGFGLTGLGVTFTLVGVFLFFDKSFVAIGNGSASFAVGFFLIMLGWPVLGMIGEIYGLFVMFSGFWFTVFLRKLPIIGGLFRQSSVSAAKHFVIEPKNCFLILCNAFNVKGLTWAYETPFEDYSLTSQLTLLINEKIMQDLTPVGGQERTDGLKELGPDLCGPSVVLDWSVWRPEIEPRLSVRDYGRSHYSEFFW